MDKLVNTMKAQIIRFFINNVVFKSKIIRVFKTKILRVFKTKILRVFKTKILIKFRMENEK